MEREGKERKKEGRKKEMKEGMYVKLFTQCLAHSMCPVNDWQFTWLPASLT